MGGEKKVMVKSHRKKRFNLSRFRRQQEANRRFYIKWINRMVKKEVEKQTVEQRSEFLLLNEALREKMLAELQERLKELVAEKARQQRQWMVSWWLRKMEEEYEKKIEEDKDKEAESLDLETLSWSESSSDTSSSFMMRTASICRLVENLNVLLELFHSDDDTRNDSIDISSPSGECEQPENKQISPDVASVAHTSQSQNKPKNPFQQQSSFMTEQAKCEEERVQAERTEEEKALTERQWAEWMDEQERRENLIKVHVFDQKNKEKQGEPVPPVSKKQKKKNVKKVGTVKKIKTYLTHLFNPPSVCKWERLEEDEDEDL